MAPPRFKTAAPGRPAPKQRQIACRDFLCAWRNWTLDTRPQAVASGCFAPIAGPTMPALLAPHDRKHHAPTACPSTVDSAPRRRGPCVDVNPVGAP